MYRIDILISGGGSLIPPVLEAAEEGRLPAHIGQVVADRPAAPGLERARKLGLATRCVDRSEYPPGAVPSHGDALLEVLRRGVDGSNDGGPDLVVLAGFLSILQGQILRDYWRRIINTHPALLPAFGGRGMYGSKVHRAVIASGEKRSGCSVHYVDAGVDSGEIIHRGEVELSPRETAQSLERKVRAIEGRILVEAIEKVFASWRGSGWEK